LNQAWTSPRKPSSSHRRVRCRRSRRNRSPNTGLSMRRGNRVGVSRSQRLLRPWCWVGDPTLRRRTARSRADYFVDPLAHWQHRRWPGDPLNVRARPIQTDAPPSIVARFASGGIGPPIRRLAARVGVGPGTRRLKVTCQPGWSMSVRSAHGGALAPLPSNEEAVLLELVADREDDRDVVALGCSGRRLGLVRVEQLDLHLALRRQVGR
jgi:hypothetical protein